MQSPQFQLHAEIEERHWWFVGRRRIMRRLVEALLPPHPDALVVDVGCGTGANIAALADSYSCTGIDTAAEATRLAQARFPRVQFLTGYAPDDLGPLAQQAQLFLMMDVLEHIENDAAVLARLVAAARPGAQFLLTVPADMALWSVHDESFGHFRRYDRPQFERLWRDLPVTCRMVSYFSARLYWPIRSIRTWGRLRGRAAGTAGTDFWMPSSPINRLLEGLFVGESARLLRLLDGRGRPYRRGASLLTVLRRN